MSFYLELERPARKILGGEGESPRTMDLTDIKGLGPARRDKLVEAGVESIEALAEADPSQLSETVAISENVLEGLRDKARALADLSDLEGASAEDLDALVGAGVRSVEELEAADASDLATATGIDAQRIEGWQQAGSPVGETAQDIAEGAIEAGEIARKSLSDARVVLREGVNDARVKFEEDVLAEARILPIKAKENADQRLEKIRGDVVVLREAADTALIRIGDDVVEGLPIFKEKVSEAGQSVAEGAEEVRVRVQEVRDKRVLPEAQKLTQKIKGLFGRD